MNIEELEMTVSKKRHELHEAAEAWMQFSQARQEKDRAHTRDYSLNSHW